MAKKNKSKNIGLNINSPEKTCSDKKCPFHGSVKIRGASYKGLVVNDKMTKGVVVYISHVKYIPKYKRYERRSSRILAHNPQCIEAKIGDSVIIGETRPLTKNIHFVVVEKVRV